MTSHAYSPPVDKAVAVLFALPLIGAETGLNAEHIAAHEGWLSTLVIGTVAATLAAAAAIPIAERAILRGDVGKAAGFAIFFALMVVHSFTTAVGRTGSAADDALAAAKSHNGRIALLREALADAVQAAKTECASGRGTKCKDAEKAAREAREALLSAPAPKAEGAMEKRLSEATSLGVATVALYQPLFLPLGLQLGGFAFLAYGLAPRRRIASDVLDLKPEPVATVEPVAEVQPAPLAIEKPRAAKKPKPRRITHQPAIMAKVDGRKTRGMKTKAANNNADFAPAND